MPALGFVDQFEVGNNFECSGRLVATGISDFLYTEGLLHVYQIRGRESHEEEAFELFKWSSSWTSSLSNK